MKKILSVFSIISLLLFFGCKSDGAKVNIKANVFEGSAPLNVNFDISSSEAVSLSEFHAFQVKIIEEGKEPDKALVDFNLSPTEMQFDHEFTIVGKYEVAVSIVDSYGGVGKGSVEINVTSPFSGKKWSPDLSPIYANELLEISSKGIDLKNIKYFWEVKKGKETVLVGEGADFKAEENLNPGKYSVELTVEDEYGNSHKYAAVQIEVLSTEAPKGLFSASYKGSTIDAATNVYEYETIVLDASESLAAVNKATGIKVKSIEWSILKDGKTFEKIKKTSGDAFEYTLGEAGTYDFAFQITNTVGLKAASNRVLLDVRKNMPSISDVVVSDFFEGVAGPINFTVNESPSPIKGEIASIILNIDGFDSITIEDVENVMWTPPYDGDSFSDKHYIACLTVINEAGREFTSDDFTLKVKDNNPRPVLIPSAEAIMYDSIIDFKATGSYSPDESGFDELSFVIERNGVAVAGTNHDFLGDMNTAFSPDVFKGASAEGTYAAVLTGRVGDRVQVTSKAIRVTPKAATASFIISPDPDTRDIFEGEEIAIDATGSYGSDGSSILNENFSWVVKNNGESTGRSPISFGTGLFKYKFEEDDFGSFSFELTVTDGDGTTGSQTKEFAVKMNKPTIYRVTKQNAPVGTQQMLVEVECPDGNYDGLIYKWYDSLPGDGVIPTYVGNPAIYNFTDGEDHLIYIEVINVHGFSAVKEYILKADDLTPPEVPTVTTDYVKIDVVNDIGITNEARPTWRWFANDPNDDAVEYRFAVASEGVGEPASPEFWSKTTSKQAQAPTVLTKGRYTVYVQARDDAEPMPNWSTSGTNTLEVDLEAPVAPVMNTNIDSYNVTGRTKDGKPTWSWEPGQASDTYGYRYRFSSSDAWTLVDNSIKLHTPASDFTDGIYELSVQARDKAGNWSTTASSVWNIDNVGPEITLKGDDLVVVNVDKSNPAYVDEGAEAHDFGMGQDVAVTIIGENAVDTTQKNQNFTITFIAEDDLGNESIEYRTVQVRDIEPPVITLVGSTNITLYMDDSFTEPGFSAEDNCDGDVTDKVDVSCTLNTSIAGYYQTTYSVTDEAGNNATATRNFTVLPKAVNFLTQLEMDMITDDDPVSLEWGLLAGATSYDVSRASTYSGEYTPISSVDLAGYNENPGYGVFFYKVTGYLGSLPGKTSTIVKVARVPESKVTGLTASKNSTQTITVTWNNFNGVSGYRLRHSYVDTPADTAVGSAIVLASTKNNLADVRDTKHLANSSSPNYVVGNASVKADVQEHYFWIDSYVDKEAAGWVSGGKLYGTVAGPIEGKRQLTNEEWVREVNLSVYEALKTVTPVPKPGTTWNDNNWTQSEIYGGKMTGYNAYWSVDYGRGYIFENVTPRYLTINGIIADMVYYERTGTPGFYKYKNRNVRISARKNESGTSEFMEIGGVYPGEFRYHMHINTGEIDTKGGPPPWTGTEANGVCGYSDNCTRIKSNADYFFERQATPKFNWTHIGYPYQIKRDGASSATNMTNTTAMWDFRNDL